MRSAPGFTLIETLAALAIGSVILVAVGLLLHQNIFFFDRSARLIDRSDQFTALAESLKRDFGAARFVMEKKDKNPSTAFAATPLNDKGRQEVRFVSAGGRASGWQGEEIISLKLESDEGSMQLVRRRAAWSGPRMSIADTEVRDAVILLKGRYQMAFAFSQLAPDGKLEWFRDWDGKNGLPHSVRLTIKNADGADVIPALILPVHANASVACVSGDKQCLGAPDDKEAKPGAQARADQ